MTNGHFAAACLIRLPRKIRPKSGPYGLHDKVGSSGATFPEMLLDLALEGCILFRRLPDAGREARLFVRFSNNSEITSVRWPRCRARRSTAHRRRNNSHFHLTSVTQSGLAVPGSESHL